GAVGIAGGITTAGTASTHLFSNSTASTTVLMTLTNQGSGAAFRVNDEASDTTPFIVDAGGNVGVKTTSPSTDFEVAGNAKATTLSIGSSAALTGVATNAETLTGTSTATVVTPAGDNFTTWLESYDQQDVSAFVWNAGVTGGMTVLQTVNYKNLNHGAITAAGTAQIVCLNFNQAGRTQTQGIDWTKKVVFSFLLSRSQANPSAGCVFRGFLGKTQAGIAVGDLIAPGIGIKIEGAGVVQLMAHNGTSLVTNNTSYTPNGGECFAVKLVSYGNGTVECFVNGTSVGTNTNAPNAAAGTYRYNGGFECQQVAAVTTTTQWTVSNIKQSFGRR
ncbi:MAG TPA: hypothetical protein VLA31_06540, partial [Burkholderiaceae bacterium]|nr:hypothetical protein [Burkholderiaceae bacterium]